MMLADNMPHLTSHQEGQSLVIKPEFLHAAENNHCPGSVGGGPGFFLFSNHELEVADALVQIRICFEGGFGKTKSQSLNLLVELQIS